MFNSIRQYLSFSHNDGLNDEYLHQDNSWRQQKNHLIGNWLSDMSQQAEEKESNRHFWNRRSRKKYYKNDLYNDDLYQQQQQQQLHHHRQHLPQISAQHQSQHLPQHLPQIQAQHQLQGQPQHQLQGQPQHLPPHQQPMFDRHRSHRSLSSLFRKSSTSNLMHQQFHQQSMYNGESNNHDYRRQRHNSLPSSYNGQHKNRHQDNFTSYQQQQQQQQSFFPPNGMQSNGFNKHGLDNEFQQSYNPRQQQQQQQMEQQLMMNVNNMHHDSYNQEGGYYKQPYSQQQSYFNNIGPSSARELQHQQQQMLYFQQQQQQQQQFPYNAVNSNYGGNRLTGNHNNLYSNEIMTNSKMFR